MCATGATTINHLAESGPLKNINIRQKEERSEKYVRVGIKRGEDNGAWCLLMYLPERTKQGKVRKEWPAFMD